MWLNGICLQSAALYLEFQFHKENYFAQGRWPIDVDERWVNEWMGGKANVTKSNVFLTAVFLVPLLSLKIQCLHFRYGHNNIMLSLVSDCIWEPVLGVWGTDYILSVIPKNFYLSWKKTSCLQCQSRCYKIVGKKGRRLPSLRLHLAMSKM